MGLNVHSAVLSTLSVAGMGVPQWFVLPVTILLLVCEVTISQLCSSLIILVDSFHTLFILIHMALTPQTASGAPPLSSPDPPTFPPQPPPSSAASSGNRPAESSTNHLPGTASELPVPAEASSPDLGCGLSYTSCRIQVVGGFLSALVLASLCLSGIIEIINLLLGPKPVQRHLLPVVVSSSSLLHKILVLWLKWDRQQTPDTKSTLKVNHRGSIIHQLHINFISRCENMQYHNTVYDFLTRHFRKIFAYIYSKLTFTEHYRAN